MRRRKAREQRQTLVVPNAARLLKRLQRTNTPTFYALGWDANGTTHRRGTFSLTMSFINPDPIYWTSLYVHVFIGPALLSADEVKPWHWSMRGLTQPDFDYIRLDHERTI